MLNGLYVPNFAAFNRDGSVDNGAIESHTKWLLTQGVSGLVPFGTFGEGASLSLREKIKITNFLLKNKQSTELIPCLICNSLGEIQEFMKEFQGVDFSAILVIPPSYFRPLGDNAIIEFYKSVAASTEQKIIAYNIPWASETISAEILAKVPVWGVKDSSGDFESAKRFLATGKKLLIGSEALLVKTMEIGSNGGILGLANIFPQTMVEIYSSVNRGENKKAAERLAHVLTFVNLAVPPNAGAIRAIGGLKAAANAILPTNLGFMRNPVPSTELSKEEITKIKNHVAEFDLK